MKIKSVYEKYGCLINLGLVIAGFYLLVKVSELYDAHEERKADKAALVAARGDSCLRMNNVAEAVGYFKSAYAIYGSDSLAARILACEQYQNHTDEAVRWLDELQDRVGESDFITMRRCDIMLQDGDTASVRTMLDAIIDDPVRLPSTWLSRSMFDIWWNRDADYTRASRYFNYYVAYLGKLMAITRRLAIAKDTAEYDEVGKKLFRLAEDRADDYAVMNGYLDLLRENPRVFYLIDWKEQVAHTSYVAGIGGYDTRNIMMMVSQLKWNLFNGILFFKHQRDGYDAAVDYALDITCHNTCNTDSYNNYSKFIFGIYLGARYKDRFPTRLTKADLDRIIRETPDTVNRSVRTFLTVGRVARKLPGISVKKSVRGDRFKDPVLILSCNDWNWQNDSLTFPDYVSRHATDLKILRYIDDNFNPCTSMTEEDKFGLEVELVPVSRQEMAVYQAEYDKGKR